MFNIDKKLAFKTLQTSDEDKMSKVDFPSAACLALTSANPPDTDQTSVPVTLHLSLLAVSKWSQVT